jgi:hypothetical protein
MPPSRGRNVFRQGQLKELGSHSKKQNKQEFNNNKNKKDLQL